MYIVSNVTNEYYANKRKEAEIYIPIDYDLIKHKEEVSIAKFLSREFNIYIELLTEINENKIKTPDFRFNDNYWEIKNVSSANSIDKRVKIAIQQIVKNIGGIVLIIDRSNIDIAAIKEIVFHRIDRTKIVKIDIIFIKNEKIIEIDRYEKIK